MKLPDGAATTREGPPWNCPKGYGICWGCTKPCEENIVTRAMHIYPDRPEHHEAAAEFKKNRTRYDDTY